jgi:hypothetical protein
MTENSSILRLRKLQVRLGDLPDENAEIAGGLSNGNLLSRLKEMTPDDPADFAEASADEDESAESDV